MKHRYLPDLNFSNFQFLWYLNCCKISTVDFSQHQGELSYSSLMPTIYRTRLQYMALTNSSVMSRLSVSRLTGNFILNFQGWRGKIQKIKFSKWFYWRKWAKKTITLDFLFCWIYSRWFTELVKSFVHLNVSILSNKEFAQLCVNHYFMYY